jgi:hypothetical protein
MRSSTLTLGCGNWEAFENSILKKLLLREVKHAKTEISCRLHS